MEPLKDVAASTLVYRAVFDTEPVNQELVEKTNGKEKKDIALWNMNILNEFHSVPWNLIIWSLFLIHYSYVLLKLLGLFK